VGADQVSTTITSEVYADDYLLGNVQIGVPWDAICRRSADGFKVVVSKPSADADVTPGSVKGGYYFDLRDINEVYRLLPASGEAGGDLAISPDNRTVAFWGCGGRDGACGVYLHDMETHKWRKLTDNEEGASGFVWSPDGKTLIWMTAGKFVIAMDVESGEITYVSDYDAVNQAPPTQSPMLEWGIDFPPQTAGLEGCIYPPLSES
jgi:hypothetical protein